MGAGSLNMDDATISEAEAKALKEGISFALRKGYTNLQVEGDSRLVIQAVLGNWSIPWNLSAVVAEFRRLVLCQTIFGMVLCQTFPVQL